ncbi:B12-binding domain-containing radical SAM protein (plasmid) [Clostridium perfringens]|nr:radical SAM protein [Clostridium perfringens]
MNKKYDVTFINAPNHAEFPHFPIGIGYLNEILKKNNISTNLIDIQNMIVNKEIRYEANILNDIENILKNIKSEIFIFSIMNSTYIWAIEIIKIIKKYNLSSKIVVGGSHATLLKEKLLEHNEIDVVCIYEGEKIITKLTNALIKNDKNLLREIKNIYYRDDDNKIVFNGEEKLIVDLDRLPIIYYSTSEYKNRTSISLDVGRGCPHNCTFCVTKSIWKRFPRYKSPKRIVEESSIYYDMIPNGKRKMVLYEHDNFIFNKNILSEVAYLKKKLKKNYYFGCSGELNDINDEVIELLDNAGCKYIFIGIETGSKRMQKIINKNLDLRNCLEKISKLNEKNIVVEVNFIIGYPEEYITDLIESYYLMTSIKFSSPKLNNINFSMLSPEPTSKVEENLKEEYYLYDKKSIYHKDLNNSLIDINKYKKKFTNHLYIIRNENYDVEKIRDFSQIFIDMLNNFSITLYILMYKINIKIDDMVSYYLKVKKDNLSILEFLMQYTHLIKNYELFEEIFRYEELIYRFKNNMKFKNDIEYFNYDIKNIYRKLKENPKNLEDKFIIVKKPFKIKVDR